MLVGVSPRFPSLLPIVKSGLDYVFRRRGLSELPRLGGSTAAFVAVFVLDAFEGAPIPASNSKSDGKSLLMLVF